MRVISQLTRAVFLSSVIGAGCWAAGRYAKDWFTMHVSSSDSTTGVNIIVPALPILYATNPSAYSLLDSSPVVRQAQSTRKLRKDVDAKSVLDRCLQSTQSLNVVIDNLDTSDGIKLVHINIAKKLTHSVLTSEYIRLGFDPAIILAMDKIADDAKDMVTADRTWEDYAPIESRTLALLGLALAFVGYRRRDADAKPGFVFNGNFLLVAAAAIFANYAADSVTQTHPTLDASHCERYLSKDGLQQIRYEDKRTLTQRISGESQESPHEASPDGGTKFPETSQE